LKIYFATTVLGDRSRVANGRRLASEMTALGHEVLTEHLFEDGAFESDSQLTARQIYDRDLAWLHDADVVLVEASGSSFGIGFETGYTLGALRAPLYLLYDADAVDRISRMAVGLRHDRATLVPYVEIDEAVEFLRATFA
jgi:nucleoside 2-deoxyribosyltransferase